MQSKNSMLVLLLALLIFSSCAKDIVVNYGNPSPNSGNIVVRPTSSVYSNLTFNDSLLVKYKYVKSITIKNVPEGVNTIHFSGESNNLKKELDLNKEVKVTAGKTNTQLVTVPPKSNGYWVSEAFTIIGLYSLLFIAY